MSNFGNAFREARNSGQTTFNYKGKLYSTQMAGESKDQWAKNLQAIRRPAIQYQDAVLNTIANNWASQMANNNANVVQSNNSPVMVGANLPDVRGFGAQVPYGRPSIPSGYDLSNQRVRNDVNRYFYAPPDTNGQRVAPTDDSYYGPLLYGGRVGNRVNYYTPGYVNKNIGIPGFNVMGSMPLRNDNELYVPEEADTFGNIGDYGYYGYIR